MSRSEVDRAFVMAWEAALSGYSDSLDEHREMLLAVEVEAVHAECELHPPAEFVPPAGLPPLPEMLLPWARQLLDQTSGLVQLASELAARSERAIGGRASNQRHRGTADTAASTWDALL